MTIKPLRRRPDRTLLLLLQMSGDVHPNPGPVTKYPCPVCARNVTSRRMNYQCNRCSGWVHAKCYGLLNTTQYRRSSDWACAPVRHHHLLPILHLQIKILMTACSKFYSLTQMELVKNDRTRSRNGEQQSQSGSDTRVKAQTKIQEPLHPELHHSSKDRPHGQGAGLLIVIHRSVIFSKQPSSAESLYNPHLEELAIEAEIGNRKLIISNINIPPTSSCSNGYQSQ